MVGAQFRARTIALSVSLLAVVGAQALPAHADAGASNGQLVAQGVLTDSAGRPASGAAVTLYAWPSGDVTSRHTVGDTVQLQPVGQGSTGRDGSFAMEVADVAALGALADHAGVVNFEVVARSTDGTASFDFTRRLSADRSVLTDLSQERGSARAAAPAKASLRAEQAAVATSQGDAFASAPAVDKGCSVTLKQDYGPRWDGIGATYSTTTGVTHDLVYNSGANSTLGVGYSISGSAGTWRQSGTAGMSSNVTLGYPAAGDYTGRYYRTQFAYGKYFYLCSYSDGSSDSYYKARPYSFVASTGYLSVSAPTAGYCGNQLAGAYFKLDRSTSITYSNGLDIDYYIGIDLSTQTGYTSSTALTFNFKYQRRLCGTHDYPGGTPRQLVAKL